jgi:hypothetical protein
LEEAETQHVVHGHNDLMRRLISSLRVTGGNTITARNSNVESHDMPAERTFISKERHSSVTAEDLSERWGISFDQAAQTLKKTTQRMIRLAVMLLGRRCKADTVYKNPRLRAGEWFIDSMDGRVVSKDGNRYRQVFANNDFFVAIYPMEGLEEQGWRCFESVFSRAWSPGQADI